MKIAFWSKVHWGCCVENGSETSLPPVQVFCIVVQRMRELQIKPKNSLSGSFTAHLLAVLHWWHEYCQSWRKGTGHDCPFNSSLSLFWLYVPVASLPGSLCWSKSRCLCPSRQSCLSVLKLVFLLLRGKPAQGADVAEHELLLYQGCSSGSVMGGNATHCWRFFFFKMLPS